MKTSLLRRMILAQGTMLVLSWLISTSTGIWDTYISKQGIFYTLGMASSALIALLPGETDPARIQLQARWIEELQRKDFATSSNLNLAEYRPLYQVFDGRGRILYRSETAPPEPMSREGVGLHSALVNGESYWIQVQEAPVGQMRVIVASSKSLARRLLWRGAWQSSLNNLICFVLFALLTWLVSLWALRPLRRLALAVEARSPEDLRPLDRHLDLKEARALIEAMNRLFQQVAELLAIQRCFVADATHELQAPLAVIEAQALALQYEEDPRSREAAAEELHRRVERAAHLVGQLLILARLDAATSVPSETTLDLAALVRERTEAVVPEALKKEQDLGYEGPTELTSP